MINAFIRPCEGRISSVFQKNRLDPVSKKFYRDHNGVDFAKLGVVPIKAVADGKVVLVRKEKTFGTYGNVIMIEHVINGKIVTTVYAHLASFGTAEGRMVKQGQNIGAMGKTGNSAGQHLHFELHLGRCLINNKKNMTYAYAVDPMMYLPLEVDLKLGDRGPNVELIQRQLVSIGYLAAADGSYGPKTESAVKSFQNANKITVDGVCGPLTQKALANVRHLLKVDGILENQTITALQRYFGTTADGVISSPSSVIKDLQKMLGTKQDGYLGPITIRALQKRFGTPQDGVISKPSAVIKELQRRLNLGKL